MPFDKKCGRMQLIVGPPSPQWCTIIVGDLDCAIDNLQPDDLRDLRYLIGRALGEK